MSTFFRLLTLTALALVLAGITSRGALAAKADCISEGTLQIGTHGDDVLCAAAREDSTLKGHRGDDELYGRNGNDELYGHRGDDFLDGGYSNDELYGGRGNDELDGSWGDDELYGGRGNDELDGSYGNDILYGNQGDDELDGGWGDDELYGGWGDDVLNGGDGNDILHGGKGGNDTLRGSFGGDDFMFRSWDTGDKTIVSFDREDFYLSLDDYGFPIRDDNGRLLMTPSPDRIVLSGGNWPPVADILASEEEVEKSRGTWRICAYTLRQGLTLRVKVYSDSDSDMRLLEEDFVVE